MKNTKKATTNTALVNRSMARRQCICGASFWSNGKIGKVKFCKRHEYLKDVEGRDYTREMVRVRDKHTCQSCLTKWKFGRKFDVHHLNGLCGKMSRRYDRVSDIDRLITYCHSCHLSIHVPKERFKNRMNTPLDIPGIRKQIQKGKTYDQAAKELGTTQANLFYRLNGRS